MKLAVRWGGVIDKSMCTPGKIDIVPIAPENIEGFHTALDVVARERKYLTWLEAPPFPEMRSFVLGMIDKGIRSSSPSTRGGSSAGATLLAIPGRPNRTVDRSAWGLFPPIAVTDLGRV